MPSIYSSRLGFSYQDKMACLLFLRELREGAVKELFTDFPIPGSQRSLDILLRVAAGDATKERVYEVKTGEYFKKDSKSKSSSEVRDVVLAFLEYSEHCPDFDGFISFSSGLENGINAYIGPANTLRLSQRLNDAGRNAAKELIAKLGIAQLNTQKLVHDFFRRVRFDEQPYDNDHTWSTLDEHIESEITGIANTLGTNDHVHILPNAHLAARLLFIVQKHTGTGNDIAKELLAELMAFMALRKELNNHTATGTPEQRESAAELYVTGKMIDNYRVESLLPEVSANTAPMTATDTGTGGIIS